MEGFVYLVMIEDQEDFTQSVLCVCKTALAARQAIRAWQTHQPGDVMHIRTMPVLSMPRLVTRAYPTSIGTLTEHVIE